MKRSKSHLIAALAIALLSPSSMALADSAKNSGHAATHHGSIREVPTTALQPYLRLEALADTKDGVNLALVTDNFTFNPKLTGQPTDVVEGHAHLYVNDVKIGRVYGHWTHLPARLFQEGENTVRVSLNDTMHSPWAADGHPIESTVIIGWKDGVADNLSYHAAHH